MKNIKSLKKKIVILKSFTYNKIGQQLKNLIYVCNKKDDDYEQAN